jgi:hypothetical protein
VRPERGIRDARLRLPFDQYQRYRIVADALEILRGEAGALRILDVGGGEGAILRFLSGDEVTVLDLSDSPGVPGLVKGDATALPFDDESFDYVTSVDVYEHIEPGARERYLSELRRTARRGVLLAAPFDSEMVRAAERVANELHRSLYLAQNVWLGEHAANGLPRLEEAKGFFEERGDSVQVLPNGYIPHWLAMLCLTFYGSKLGGESSDLFDEVNEFYNEFMYELDNAEPSYRHLLVSLRGPAQANLDELASHKQDPEGASRSLAFFSVLPIVLDLNTRLAQKEGALARKEAQVNDLSRRLAELVRASDVRHLQGRLETEKQIRDYDNVVRQRDDLQQQLAGITGSRAWWVLTALHKLRVGIGRVLGSG